MINECLAPVAISLGDKIIEMLVDNGMVLDDLSRETGVSNESLVPFFMGEEELTQDFADQLAKVFSTSAEFWLELDRKYHTLSKDYNKKMNF
ncbi:MULTISPECIES: helix-turn-helix transcriptional regulator [Paenibacillus]|uniref:helix-turn-helix transcriptional regulator n=1 Tax=Paenibacillus TaxID=44249 RepID=UPI0009A8F949|nr:MULTISPECIES: hypothetical protein [Paenibacillus]MCZ1267699.1 hypothetical protein [Paenibacillus tundrae]SLK16144.1 hypothetical protein SAMN06272722_11083 [Paenibacillus sp. RU5A]SOC74222.1 hypothetical protein SAMN05880581_11083 [Paenibacillus sp. RU26A]SOC76372.1 hypothetical protein SAMN05880586_11083 [Paenibacillus sp. RU5M]